VSMTTKASVSPPATPETPPRPRGRPPKVRPVVPDVEPAASPEASPAGLDALELRAQAPIAAAAEAGEALRTSMDVIEARAAACDQRLQALEQAGAPRLQRVRRLPFSEFTIRLGGGQGLLEQIRAVVDRLSILFQPRVDPNGTTKSVRQVLAGIAPRIAQLTAADLHRCPTPPPPCGCVVNMIRVDVENAERAAIEGIRDVDILDELLLRLEHALVARGGGEVIPLPPRHSATGHPTGVGVITSTGPARPAPAGDMAEMAYNPFNPREV
jgi:hypothetical protein